MYRHVVRGLSRAGAAVVAVADDGCRIATAFSPVWAGLPQTAPGAEHFAAALAASLVQGPSNLCGVNRAAPGEGGEGKRLWPAWTDLHWFSNHDPHVKCMTKLTC